MPAFHLMQVFANSYNENRKIYTWSRTREVLSCRLSLSIEFISYSAIFFSHNKSANMTYQPNKQDGAASKNADDTHFTI